MAIIPCCPEPRAPGITIAWESANGPICEHDLKLVEYHVPVLAPGRNSEKLAALERSNRVVREVNSDADSEFHLSVGIFYTLLFLTLTVWRP